MSEDFYFGYVRPAASGITSYQTGTYTDPIYHRYGVADWETATGEAAYQYQPIERTAMQEVLLPLGFGRETTDWYPRTDRVNIEVMYFWVANMSDERTYALAEAWLAAHTLLSQTSMNLRGHAETLVAGWSSPAADAFLQRVGAALCSLDEWWHVALDNAGGLRMIADAIRLAQINMTRLYGQYRDHAEVLALAFAEEERLWDRSRDDPPPETTGIGGSDPASRVRRTAIVRAQEDFHDRAVQYTKPVADIYDEVLFTRLGQGRRYEGPLIDFGAASASVYDRMRALQEDLMARLGVGAGAGGLVGPPLFPPMAMPMPAFAPPPAFQNASPQGLPPTGFVGEMVHVPADGHLAGGHLAGGIVAPAMPTGPAMAIGPAMPTGQIAGGVMPPGAGSLHAAPPAMAAGLPGIGGLPSGGGPNGLAGRPAMQVPGPGGSPAGGVGSAGYPPPPQIPGAPGRNADQPARGAQARATPSRSGVRGAGLPSPALPGVSGSARQGGPGAHDRAGRLARPALSGASVPSAVSRDARTSVSQGAANTERTRQRDTLHVPGQHDDSLWTVETPKAGRDGPAQGTA